MKKNLIHTLVFILLEFRYRSHAILDNATQKTHAYIAHVYACSDSPAPTVPLHFSATIACYSWLCSLTWLDMQISIQQRQEHVTVIVSKYDAEMVLRSKLIF